MKLYDTLKDVFVGELTPDEQQDLAKFASSLLTAKRKRDGVATSGLLKQASEEIHDMWDFDRTAHLLLHLTKTAATTPTNWDKASDYALKGGMLLAATAPLIMAATNAIRKNMKFDQSFHEVIRERPMLAGEHMHQTRRHFDALKTFAPDVAQNSLVAGNVLHRMHRLGPEWMDVNVIKELSNTQKFISDHHKATSERNQGGALKSVGDTVKTIGEVFKPKEVVDPIIGTIAEIENDNKLLRVQKEQRELAKEPSMFDEAIRLHGIAKQKRGMEKDLKEWADKDAKEAKSLLPQNPAYLGVRAHK